MTDSLDVLVIGAGPAGLTAAHHLVRHSRLRTRVVEVDPVHLGGLSRTQTYREYRFDIGGHRFFSKSREIEALWEEFLPNGLLVRPRKSRILYRGKFYSYPLKALEALGNLGPLESVRCVASYAKARLFPVRRPRSFHEWVANQFGERLFEIFFRTYTEKVWGMGCDDLSADWAAQRIRQLDLATAIRDALSRQFRRHRIADPGREGTVRTLIEEFRYPRLGPGMMWDSAGRRIRELGGEVVLGSRVTRLVWDGLSGVWTVTVHRADGTENRVTARHVLCSAPLREIVEAVEPAPRSRDQAARLRYRDFLTVPIIVRRSADLFDDNWIYVHDPGVRVGRIQNYGSWSPEMVPDAASACLGLEYFCFENDELWSRPDSNLVSLASDELVALGLVARENIIDGCVIRQAKAYPVYDDAYRDALSCVRAEFDERFPTIQFIGRNGQHRYNNQDHAMMTGLLAAENVLAGRRICEPWDVNDDAEYLEQVATDRIQALQGVRRVPSMRAR